MKTGVKIHKKPYSLIGWIMVLIAGVLVAIFNYIPTIQAFFLSLQSGKGNNLSFSGLSNYIQLLTDTAFHETVFNTILFTVFQVPIMILLAVIVAVLLNDNKLKFRGFFRTCIFLPCVTSLVSYSVLFKNIFSVDGLLNKILLNLHIIDSSISWLLDPIWSKVVIVIALIWRWTGYYMIFFLAGLQNIDKSIYEASEIDGCNSVQSLFKITLPLLKPIVFLTSILAINSTL